MSSKNNLRFVTLGVSAFAGLTKSSKIKIEYPQGFDIGPEINDVEKENGLVIVFPQGYGYIEIEGNQGVGKTSLIECLKEATGGIADSKNVNADLNDKSFKDRFWGIDGKLYQFKQTKATVTLERIEFDDDGKPMLDAKKREVKVEIKSPKTMLQQIVGPAGIDPMSLKQMNGQEQVKWLRSLYTLDMEAQQLEFEVKQKHDKAFKERTTANATYARLNNLILSNTYYKEYEKWDKYFSSVKYEDLEKEVSKVQRDYQLYQNSKNAMPALDKQLVELKSDVTDLERQIKELQVKLESKNKSIEELESRIETGKRYIDDNISITETYQNLSGKIEEFSSYKAKKQSFDQMLQLKAEWDTAENEKIRLDKLVNEYAQLKKDYVKQFSPDIPDFEVCIADEADKREGLFYKKKSLAILAESELWEFATQLWKVLGVKIIYVENVSSLGSGAVEKFNSFLSSGGAYIFGTKMNRNEDNLKISFHNKIPM